MNKVLYFSFIKFALLSSLAVRAQAPAFPNGWDTFAQVKFKPKYVTEVNGDVLFPMFDANIRAKEGKEIFLKGYVMPFDIENNEYLILSKFPYSSCFFCGGAGPESVALVYLKDRSKKFKGDQVIKVKGILKLNDKDLNLLNFLVKDAELVQ